MIFTTFPVSSTFLVPASSTRFWSLSINQYIDWLIDTFSPIMWVFHKVLISILIDWFFHFFLSRGSSTRFSSRFILKLIGTHPTFCVVVNIAFTFQKIIGTCVIHKLSVSPPHQMLWFNSVDISNKRSFRRNQMSLSWLDHSYYLPIQSNGNQVKKSHFNSFLLI